MAQLGLLHQQEGNLPEAVKHLAQALGIFQALGAPQAQQASRDLARLRETMGEDAFASALAGFSLDE